MNIVNFCSDTSVDLLKKLVCIGGVSLGTEQIFVVVDSKFWLRLYWNPISKLWQVAKHTKKGWGKTIEITTVDLIKIIPRYETLLKRSKGIEYKNITGNTTYLPVT